MVRTEILICEDEEGETALGGGFWYGCGSWRICVGGERGYGDGEGDGWEGVCI